MSELVGTALATLPHFACRAGQYAGHINALPEAVQVHLDLNVSEWLMLTHRSIAPAATACRKAYPGLPCEASGTLSGAIAKAIP